MGAGHSTGGPPSRLQFSYRPYGLTVPFATLGLFEDSSTPAIVTTTGTSNPTTASFSPPANTLLVAIVGGGWGTPLPTKAVVTDSIGLTWLVGASVAGTKSTAGGVSLIAYTYLVTAPGPMMVGASFTNFSGGSLLAVRVLNNASPSQLGAGSAVSAPSASTAGTVSVTTTYAGSLVYGIGGDSGNNDVLTLNGATTALASGTYSDATDHITLVAWKATTLTGTPGATVLGGTWAAATSSAVVGLEILPVTAPILSVFPPTIDVFSQAAKRAAFF